MFASYDDLMPYFLGERPPVLATQSAAQCVIHQSYRLATFVHSRIAFSSATSFDAPADPLGHMHHHGREDEMDDTESYTLVPGRIIA
jgi:hypothetical protein